MSSVMTAFSTAYNSLNFTVFGYGFLDILIWVLFVGFIIKLLLFNK